MAGFGLPNFGQITEAFRKAQQIQQDAQKLQVELDEMKIVGSSTNEKIQITLSGNQTPLEVQVNESIFQEDKESLERLILEALQAAHEESTSTMKSRMKELTGGLNLNLPGISDEE